MKSRDSETGRFKRKKITRDKIVDALQKCEEEHGKVVGSTYSDYVSRSQILRHFESPAHAKMEAGIQNIGAVRSEDMRDLLNQYFEDNKNVQDMIIGLIMSDASVTKNTDTRNSQIQLEVANREFAERVRDTFGPLSTDVKEYEKTNKYTEFTDGFTTTVYKVRTRRLRCFNRFRDKWYADNKKEFPTDRVNITPTVLKYWYAGDGDMSTDNRWKTKHYARISCKSQQDKKDDINTLFDELSFEPNWNDNGRFTFGRYGSIDFWEYIGRDVPGYQESKCPDKSYFKEERNQRD